MATIILKGGANVGWVNVSWPFARLSVSPQEIALRVTSIGEYRFSQEQVVSIERYVIIPVLGWGIQIRHTKPDCPSKVIFWCLGSPHSLIQRIRQVGFVPTGQSVNVPIRKGIPVRWPVIIAAVLLWNILILLDWIIAGGLEKIPGPLSFLAILVAFVASTAIPRSEYLQALVLHEGRSVGEIMPFLNLLRLVSGLLLVFMVLFVALGQ